MTYAKKYKCRVNVIKLAEALSGLEREYCYQVDISNSYLNHILSGRRVPSLAVMLATIDFLKDKGMEFSLHELFPRKDAA